MTRRLISGGSIREMILPVAQPWGGGPLAKRGVEGPCDGSAKAPPSALRAATSPSLRDREDQLPANNAPGGFSALIATRTRSSASSRDSPAGIVAPIL